MVAFCSNRGIVSSRLIVQIFTRIFLSFSMCPILLKVSIVPSDVPPFSREKRDRMKYFSQQRVSKGRMKRKISTLRVMLRVTRVQGKNNEK